MGDILFSVFIPHETAVSPFDEESDTAAGQNMLAFFLRFCKPWIRLNLYICYVYVCDLTLSHQEEVVGTVVSL